MASHFFRVLVAITLLGSVSGCGYVHFGRMPATATASGDGSAEAYTNLLTEQKILKQELALARKEGDALRAAVERGPAASPELLNRMNETTRELATLRATHAKLQAGQSTGTVDPAIGVRLSDLEEKLATSLRNYTQLQEENARLRTDLERARAENAGLATQLQGAAAQNEQLNGELLAQKEARARAEQSTAALNAQLAAVLARGKQTGVTTRDNVAPPPAAAAGVTAASALQLAKAPPADSSPVAELRTNPDRLRASGPIAAEPATPPRTYVVQDGDTLEKIAEKQYGDPKRWVKIYTANNEVLRDGRPLKAGMELQIP
jgi:nucleoid-associated protein YgaU